MYPLFVDGRSATWTAPNAFEIKPDAKRFETWEVSQALMFGLTAAIRYAHTTGIEHIQFYNRKLMERLRANLTAIPNVRMFDKGSVNCNILTFNKGSNLLDTIKAHLDAHHVYYSISTMEWGLIDFQKKGIDWAIRLSPHYFNTMDEIDRVSEIIEAL
jgi:selenocysteine lyase/cysteine desulfurase